MDYQTYAYLWLRVIWPASTKGYKGGKTETQCDCAPLARRPRDARAFGLSSRSRGFLRGPDRGWPVMAARVHRKPSLQQADRLPISTYEDAVRALVVYRQDESITDEAYFLAVEIVADIFWTADKRVIRDVLVASAEIGGR